MAPLALARGCRGFGECLAEGTDRFCQRFGANAGGDLGWARSIGGGANLAAIPSRVPPLRAAAVAKRSLTVLIARPFVAHLGPNSGTIIAGPTSGALAESPWNCNISRIASPASIWLGLDQQLLTASGETLCTRRGMGCTVS
jgi:hypothetical protein